MTIITVQIESHSIIPTNVIYLNKIMIKKLNLPLNNPIDLSFGNKTVHVFLGQSTNKGNLLRIPAHIGEQLHLPNGIQIHGEYKGNVLMLGPILGILVQNILYKQPKSPFGRLTAFAQEVSQKSSAKGVLTYFFSINDMNKKNNTINGWMLRNEKWISKPFPFPMVIYNRIPSRNYEKSILPIIDNLKQKHDFIFFNDHFLNKWDVAQILKPTMLKGIIPKTILYKGDQSIRELLTQFPVIYLKPTNGSLGLGIIRIEKKSELYVVRYARVQGPTTLNFKNFSSMLKYIKPRLSHRQYLVQQGLDLITLGNRPIDFRVLVQKNASGKWAVTSMVARIANDQHFVSNLAQGGTQGNVNETIKQAKPELTKIITRQSFKNYALLIAKYIEASSTGHFAELGIDLALDNKGKIWLLEVNAKPSKTDEPKENSEPRPSVTRLINYVIYASGFHVQKNIKRRLR